MKETCQILLQLVEKNNEQTTTLLKSENRVSSAEEGTKRINQRLRNNSQHVIRNNGRRRRENYSGAIESVAKQSANVSAHHEKSNQSPKRNDCARGEQ